MKTSIVIPTYNEKENLDRLVKRIDEVCKKNGINYEILVVDDNSPDGTGLLADKLSRKFPIKVIHRNGKLGLGSAYKTGFAAASGKIIFEMDSDLSHDPKYVPDFVRAIENGNDMVIGSRKIASGKVVNWSFYRTLVSNMGCWIPKIILGLKTKDVTSGYRAYKREALKKINYKNVKSEGYVFQIEMVYVAEKKNLKIKEIPIVFIDRKKGKSKLSKFEFLKFLARILILRLSR